MSNHSLLSQLNDPALQRKPASEHLKQLKAQQALQLMDLFKTLPAPDFGAFAGPFQGTLLNSGKTIHNMFNKIVTFNPLTGAWQGKQFYVLESRKGLEKGYGYNMFGKTNRRLKFSFNTSIAPSQFDDKTSLHMDYCPHPHLLGWVHAYDEIREIDADNFLLVAHFSKGLLTKAPPIIIHLQRSLTREKL